MNAIPLKCVSKSIQERRKRPVIINIKTISFCCIPKASPSINAVVAAMILTTRSLNYVFLMLLKT